MSKTAVVPTNTDPFASDVQPTEAPTRKRRTVAALEVHPTFAGYTPKRIQEVAPDPKIYSAREAVGRAFLLASWRFLASDYDNSEYALMNVLFEDGENAIISCGGIAVVNKLRQMEEKDGPFLTRLTSVAGKRGEVWVLE